MFTYHTVNNNNNNNNSKEILIANPFG